MCIGKQLVKTKESNIYTVHNKLIYNYLNSYFQQ